MGSFCQTFGADSVTPLRLVAGCPPCNAVVTRFEHPVVIREVAFLERIVHGDGEFVMVCDVRGVRSDNPRADSLLAE